MIRLLGLVDDAPAAIAGLGRATPRVPVLTGSGPLSCVGFEWTGPPPQPDVRALRRHDGLIRALMRSCTVLPFRFWTVAEDPASLERWLAEQAGELAATMRRVRGRVELAARACADDRRGGERVSGRDYLEQVRRRHLGHPALLALHSALADSAVDTRVLAIDGSRLVAAYLVRADDADQFRGRVDRAAGAQPEIRRRSLTGPWAPYSFVDLPDGLLQTAACGHG